jgi:hypothetical protein
VLGGMEAVVVSDVHVIPVNDLMNHNEHRDCWCCPKVEAVTDDGACDVMVIHFALDMRELRE